MVEKDIRKNALKELQHLLANRPEITLAIIGDRNERELRRVLQGFESVGVCRGQVVLIRLSNGCILWSENKRWVAHYSRMLERLREQAMYREPQAVLELLEKLKASVR